MPKLEPLFDFTSGGSNILIHQSQAEVCINQNTYNGNGEVRLELLPRASINIYGYFHGVPVKDSLETLIGQSEISSFSINGYKVDGFKLSIGGSVDSQEYNLKWRSNSEPINAIGNDSTQMDSLIFHLFNFIDFSGTRRSSEQAESTMHAIDHVDLVCDDWTIELKSLLSTSETIKALKEEGGFKLTHIGSIKKSDGTLFTGKDATDCLQAVRFFLSFAKGGWSEPICSVGFDTSDNRVWESWSSPKEPWHIPFAWFDARNGIQLATLFPGFMEKWRKSDWGEALHEVIYWYLNANFSSRGIDAGIILTQAAIERLSFEFAVKDKRLLTANGFKDLWASDKFRLLFSSLGIPIELSKDTPKVEALSKKFNWLDSPHALTEIRNSLVHPEHKRRGQFNAAYYEAWNLGLWYLEMGVLAICGYSGSYGNRLKQRYVGQIETVPWVK